MVVVDSLQSLRPYPNTAAACRVLVDGVRDFAVTQSLHIVLVGHALSLNECDGLLAASDTGIRLLRSGKVNLVALALLQDSS